MAREILFKAKRKDNGEWVEGYYAIAIDKRGIRQHNILVADHSLGYFKWYVIDESTICQYTGLTDKNGNKIWENDIVQNEYERNGFQKLRIHYSTENTKYVLMNAYGMFTDFDKLLGQLEVIGNVFDNPELLGGGE